MSDWSNLDGGLLTFNVAGGGPTACRRQGVEVEDELQTLDFVSNGWKIDWPEMKKSVDWRVASPDAATRPAAPALARATAGATSTAFLLLASAFSFDSKIQFRQQNSVSTVKLSFDSLVQFRQLSSVSTVKFRDERLMYFTSSTLWLCILRHVLEMLLEFHSG